MVYLGFMDFILDFKRGKEKQTQLEDVSLPLGKVLSAEPSLLPPIDSLVN